MHLHQRLRSLAGAHRVLKFRITPQSVVPPLKQMEARHICLSRSQFTPGTPLVLFLPTVFARSISTQVPSILCKPVAYPDTAAGFCMSRPEMIRPHRNLSPAVTAAKPRGLAVHFLRGAQHGQLAIPPPGQIQFFSAVRTVHPCHATLIEENTQKDKRFQALRVIFCVTRRRQKRQNQYFVQYDAVNMPCW